MVFEKNIFNAHLAQIIFQNMLQAIKNASRIMFYCILLGIFIKELIHGKQKK